MEATVLLAEDCPEIREIYTRTLRTQGFEVLACASGTAALKAARLHTPDVLLTDYHMPGMTGVELATRLRAEHPRVPVLMVTAAGCEAAAALASVPGAAASLLEKPVELRRVLEALRSLLARPGTT